MTRVSNRTVFSPARLAALAGVLLTAVLLAACGGPGDGSGSSSERRFLSIGTAPPGGAFFVVGGALADVVGAHAAGDWQVTAEATAGTKENIRRLETGELDFALANAAITYFGVRGGADWERPYEVSAVMTLAPNVALFISPEDSGVETIADLAGERVVIGPPGAGFQDFVEPLLAGHGVAWDDLTVLYNTQAGAVDMLADGSAAAAFLGGAVPTGSITQAASGQDVRFIPFDPEAREKLIADYLFFRPATIPAGTYRGQDEAFEGLDVGSMHLVTRADQDEELVYQVTKILYEHRAEVVEKHPAGKAINPANAARDTGTAFHPGAERYYREIGIWQE